MSLQLEKLILSTTGAEKIISSNVIQNLWSNYGQIIRYKLAGGNYSSVIVKNILLKKAENNSLYTDDEFGHQRKVKSYYIEAEWYNSYSTSTNDNCRIPACLAIHSTSDGLLIFLEDLDASGYPSRKHQLSWNDMKVCINWLANFHAVFLGRKPVGLWASGTYWHLETRPHELQVLKDSDLKTYAAAIDQKLKETPFQTILHGDAKPANFCFSKDGLKVAAVDFQYTGGGCGMKDLVYFAGCCLDDTESERMEAEILDYYFLCLQNALKYLNEAIDFPALEDSWRSLYKFAWADFYRFYKGWSPGIRYGENYSERVVREVINILRS
ncbi:MAG: oxidoreductase family protein [Cytophagaceae bacterium]